ncbi:MULTISPECIES: sensor histidine kinase [Colwellia]|uniref:histidine kinase n=1 Tax=Colwellia marinimaniae TaxID=1513592 RepID=A0ABQ0MWI9_9GAMM|nr:MULTISPECIES: cache domain-containing protein [Colwellia]GAW96737.1 diguanylate cyclase [Colwellia marinimaniae]
MKVIHDKKLLRLIKIIPPLIVTAFACLTIFIVLNHNKVQLSADIQSLKQDFIASEKELIKAQVEQLIQQITYERDSTEKTLKDNIKEHIYQAHSIATNIFDNNKNKSEKEVTKLISDALRNVRFNDGRGYFFIYKTNGLSIMHPIIPEIEGTSMANFQDIRGKYIVRDLGQLAKEHGEYFYHWWFVKPDNKEQEFEKIGFGKHFAPYDWFIGTGEYLIDVENDIKQRMVGRISNIRFGLNGYIFILDYQGNVISHYRKSYQGTNLYDNADENVVTAGKKIIEIGKQGGGYLNYLSPIMPSTGNSAQKISFISNFLQWNWIIGTGFYKSETDSYLAKREKNIAQQNRSQLFRLLGLSFFVTLSFISLSLLLTKYLARRFTVYENKINANQQQLELRVKQRTNELSSTLEALKSTQSQLIEAEKMASLVGLVSGVAHELNTPLGIINTSISHIEHKIEQLFMQIKQQKLTRKDLVRLENSYQEGLRLLKLNLNKSIKLIHNFKALSLHEKSDDVQQFSVNQLIDLIVKSHQAILSEHSIKIITEINSDIKAFSYQHSLSEVLIQLIKNSYIHGFESTKEPVINIAVSENQGNICLIYRDNGCGIPRGDYEKIFEPFYTTKRTADCTGLGLTIIYNHITQRLNGTIFWDKLTSQGIKIVINFPKNVEKVVISTDH